MNQVAIDIDQCCTVIVLPNKVCIPEFVVECLLDIKRRPLVIGSLLIEEVYSNYAMKPSIPFNSRGYS